MADNNGGKKMSNDNWIDISKQDAVIVITLTIFITFLTFLGMSMA